MIQRRLLLIEHLPPTLDAGLLGIVQARIVPSVPMIAVIDRHIEADADRKNRAGLNADVDRMEAAVPGPPDLAVAFEHEVIHTLAACDQVQVREFPERAAILGEFQPREILRAFVDPPPCPVAGVENIRPRNDLVGVVDRYPS
jgi:hypothetical protein